MNFNPSEKQQKLLDAARAVCAEAIAPRAASADGDGAVVLENLKTLGSRGLLAVLVPEEFGGGGGDAVSFALCMEEIAAACGSTAMAALASGAAAAAPIALFGTEAQKKKFLPGLASGERVGGMALTEPEGGSDLAALRCAVERRDGGYVLNGRKSWVTNGPAADTVIVFARLEAEGNGLAAFIAESGLPGFKRERDDALIGARGAGICELAFEGCELPEDARLGAEPDGRSIARETLARLRIGMASMAVGMTRAALEASVQRAKTRAPSGKPIAKFQQIEAKIARMRVDLEAGRRLVHYAAWRLDRGEACEADVSAAKLFASRAAVKSAAETVQIFGADGLKSGGVAQRLYRDAKICEIAAGTSEIHRSIIARASVGR